jgi:hypothetical protein
MTARPRPTVKPAATLAWPESPAKSQPDKEIDVLKKASVGLAIAASAGALLTSSPASAQNIPASAQAKAAYLQTTGVAMSSDWGWRHHRFRHHHHRFHHHRFHHHRFHNFGGNVNVNRNRNVNIIRIGISNTNTNIAR